MKLIKPSYKIIEQEPGINGIYKMIEHAGRVCYKSEDKITEDSAKPFVNRMIKSGHGAILEQGTIYLQYETVKSAINPLTKYYHNKYSKVKTEGGITKESIRLFVTTNFRVLLENDWLDDLKYICEPTEYHERRVTVHFICDKGVSHEFVRHRVFSFAQESTRYCNYSKDKFGKELTFIMPCWVDVPEGKYTNISKQSSEDGEYKQIMLHENNINAYPLTTTPEGRFLWHCLWSEHDYFDLLEQGWQPQQARAVLPNVLKTELVMTGLVSDWKHFFSLRSKIAKTGKPHPQAQELADPLMDEFIKKGIMETLIK